MLDQRLRTKDLKNKVLPGNIVVKSKKRFPKNEKHFLIVRLLIRLLTFMRLNC